MAGNQALTLADNIGSSGPPVNSTADGLRVLIPSALSDGMDGERELRLLQHAKAELMRLEGDLGRHNFDAAGYWDSPVEGLRRHAQTFFGRRHLNHLVAQQRMEWRAYVMGGLYAESNLHLPITARIISQQFARANKGFFGTSPWFSIDGLSDDSSVLAEDVNAYARHKLVTLGGLQANLEAGVQLAFIQGEAVMKTRHHKMSSYFETFREVALGEDGQPIVTLDGRDYVYKTDKAVQDATGQMVLERDGVTPMPAGDLVFKQVKLTLDQVIADRIESRPVYYLDFLCGLENSTVQEGTAIHLYNSTVIEMAHRYITDKAFSEGDAKAQMARISRLVGELMPGTSSDQQAKGDKPRPELAETRTTNTSTHTQNEPTTGLAEVWLWYDVNGDGVMKSIMILMDRDGRVPVFYDYAANLTPDGLRPFDVLRINPIAGRWHGMGNPERFWNLQEHADLILNRYLFAESRAARVDFWNPSATIEGDRNPNLALNWGGTYRLKQGMKAEDALTSVYLTNIKSANLKDLLEIVMQMATNMSAVANVNDASMVALDAQNTATGIKNLEHSGEEQFHQYLTQLQPDIESTCKRALKYLLATVSEATEQDHIEKFFDRASSRMVSINPRTLADLDFDLKLDLTTYRSQQQLQQSQLAYNIASAFLMQPAVLQARLSTLVRQALRALEVRNADEISAPLTPEEQMQMPILMPPTAPGGDATNPGNGGGVPPPDVVL